MKYKGLVDEEGKALGEGTVTFKGGDKWTGTFVENQPHGLSK